MGRPKYYDEVMLHVGIRLPKEIVDWLKSHKQPMSVVIRDIIHRAMKIQ